MIRKILEKKIHIWFPDYLRAQLKKMYVSRDGKYPKDIIFLFVDHFEPRAGNVVLEKERERVDRWVNYYPQVASKHRDSNGRCPQHTWFYPYDEVNIENLQKLASLCFQGYGEIELHLHHGFDTSSSLKKKLKAALDSYSKVGALITAEKVPCNTYGFIHGNWALDNSRKDARWCGVNNELKILQETGCYADFTFPAFGLCAQPAKINSLYYAKDTPASKSYNKGSNVKAGSLPIGDLMLIEGPLTIDWQHKFNPVVDDGNIAGYYLPDKRRVDLWVDCNIHVIGCDSWIFVKVFTHGAVENDADIVLGKPVEDMFTYLEDKYNDGNNFRLHYVTAREAYNIIKAAEAGKMGNPNDYRDFIIKPYANTKIKCNRFYKLISYREDDIQLEILEQGALDVEVKGYDNVQLDKISEGVPYRVICRLKRRTSQ